MMSFRYLVCYVAVQLLEIPALKLRAEYFEDADCWCGVLTGLFKPETHRSKELAEKELAERREKLSLPASSSSGSLATLSTKADWSPRGLSPPWLDSEPSTTPSTSHASSRSASPQAPSQRQKNGREKREGVNGVHGERQNGERRVCRFAEDGKGEVAEEHGVEEKVDGTWVRGISAGISAGDNDDLTAETKEIFGRSVSCPTSCPSTTASVPEGCSESENDGKAEPKTFLSLELPESEKKPQASSDRQHADVGNADDLSEIPPVPWSRQLEVVATGESSCDLGSTPPDETSALQHENHDVPDDAFSDDSSDATADGMPVVMEEDPALATSFGSLDVRRTKTKLCLRGRLVDFELYLRIVKEGREAESESSSSGDEIGPAECSGETSGDADEQELGTGPEVKVHKVGTLPLLQQALSKYRSIGEGVDRSTLLSQSPRVQSSLSADLLTLLHGSESTFVQPSPGTEGRGKQKLVDTTENGGESQCSTTAVAKTESAWVVPACASPARIRAPPTSLLSIVEEPPLWLVSRLQELQKEAPLEVQDDEIALLRRIMNKKLRIKQHLPVWIRAKSKPDYESTTERTESLYGSSASTSGVSVTSYGEFLGPGFEGDMLMELSGPGEDENGNLPDAPPDINFVVAEAGRWRNREIWITIKESEAEESAEEEMEEASGGEREEDAIFPLHH